ncbi:MAG: hypothetical protein DMF76_15865 [Acidobacteria bacterium]|nr:MAG: hypothetical protein DMF76_15865 [Acidobacteriota bacterium]
MKLTQSTEVIDSTLGADRRILINALTLIALGLSILFLNSWDNLFVRTTVGLFWGTFFLILNGPDLVSVFRRFRSKNELQRRSSFRSST